MGVGRASGHQSWRVLSRRICATTILHRLLLPLTPVYRARTGFGEHWEHVHRTSLLTKSSDRHMPVRMDNEKKDQQYDRFMSFFVGGERAIRAYVRSLLPANQDVDDLMQNVGLACWHKFDSFDPDGTDQDFIRWCCVISRFEVLRFRRSRARDLKQCMAENHISRRALAPGFPQFTNRTLTRCG